MFRCRNAKSPSHRRAAPPACQNWRWLRRERRNSTIRGAPAGSENPDSLPDCFFARGPTSTVDRNGILHFVLITRGDCEIGEQVAALRCDIGAVVFKAALAREIAKFRRSDCCGICLRTECIGIGGVKTLNWVVVVLPGVRFASANLVPPVLARRKIPPRVGAEDMLIVTVDTGWAVPAKFARECPRCWCCYATLGGV